MRLRLDATLVKRGLATTRTEAVRLIEAGVVTVGGAFADKPSRMVSVADPVEVLRTPRFVSRGGDKLEGALAASGVVVEGRSVMDAGASTGGFVDCLLQRGARRVLAVDVGHNQMHERIRMNPRVTSREGVNVRNFSPADMPFPSSLVVADLSFISLTKVVAKLVRCCTPEENFPVPQLILLVKPQFEVGRTEASRGRGVITDPELHRQAIESVMGALNQSGAFVEGVVESPIKGTEGNTEFFVFARTLPESLVCSP